MLGDVLRTSFTGYYGKPPPTTPKRTNERLQNQVQACQDLLTSLVGPGDLLDSDVRFEFAYEAYYGYHAANHEESKAGTTVTTSSPYKEFALKIVNQQASLDKSTYNAFIEQLSRSYPDHDTEDHTVMAIELAVVAACCAGIRAFYTGIGKERPDFPSRHSPRKAANFQCLHDYCDGPLYYDKKVAWGPRLPVKQLKPAAIEKFNMDLYCWKLLELPDNPCSKASVAPLTFIAFMNMFHIMYTAGDVPRFMQSPGPDRFLTRGQVEAVAAGYTTTVRCRF